MSVAMWRVEVAYATPEAQPVIALSLPPGATVEQAIRASGLLARFPEIDLGKNRVGIFGEPARLDDTLRDGDRVEIYRPLVADRTEARAARQGRRGRGFIDPKEARRKRVEKK